MNFFSPAVQRIATIILLCLASALPSPAQDGFGGNATGGSGGATVTAKSAEEFHAYMNSPENLIVLVEGTLRIGIANVTSHKTIAGVDKTSTLIGNLFIGSAAQNIIIKNLNVTNPMSKKGKGGGDGITIRGGKLVWITHCTFFDCGDGCIDVTEGADWVTVSWSKFYFTNQPKHRFTMLAVGRDKNRKKQKVKSRLRITLHHNWWAEKCDSRMPSVTRAEVHLYNNYFRCAGNSYCTNVRAGAELLSQNNFYEGVNNPSYAEEDGKMKTEGNIYEKCSGKAENKNDDVFSPPYAYTLDKTKHVPVLVQERAGAR